MVSTWNVCDECGAVYNMTAYCPVCADRQRLKAVGPKLTTEQMLNVLWRDVHGISEVEAEQERAQGSPIAGAQPGIRGRLKSLPYSLVQLTSDLNLLWKHVERIEKALDIEYGGEGADPDRAKRLEHIETRLRSHGSRNTVADGHLADHRREIDVLSKDLRLLQEQSMAVHEERLTGLESMDYRPRDLEQKVQAIGEAGGHQAAAIVELREQVEKMRAGYDDAIARLSQEVIRLRGGDE